MRNVILPSSYDMEKLSKAMAFLIRLARKKSIKEMELCSGADKIDDCFTGYINGKNLLHLAFLWNEGADTRTVSGEFDVKEG